MCVTSMVTLLVHLLTLPYERLYTNITETVILALLVIINCSLVESSSVAVPEELVSLLIVLPYLFATGYIALMIASPAWYMFYHAFTHTFPITISHHRHHAQPMILQHIAH